jgi:hypothetical protein
LVALKTEKKKMEAKQRLSRHRRMIKKRIKIN